MVSIKKFGCIRSVLSLGCLTLLLIIILGAVFIWKKPINDTLFKLEGIPAKTDKQEFVNKELLFKVVLMSDSENKNDNVSYVMDYAKRSNINNVFHLGDLTSLGVPKNLKAVRNTLNVEGINVYTVPGDRDLWKSKGVSAYNKYFGDSYSFKDIKGIGFLFIDNANEYEGIGEDEMLFIKEKLPDANFVIIHNVLIPTDIPLIGNKIMGEYDSEVGKQRIKLLKMIRQSSVKAIFSGDQHYYSVVTDLEKNDLKQYVVGTVNADRSIQLPSFAVLSIYVDGTYKVDKIVIAN